MIEGIIILTGGIIGLAVGIVAGVAVGVSPAVISIFTELFFARTSGGFFGDSFNAVVFTLPLLTLAGAVVGSWLGRRFCITRGIGELSKAGKANQGQESKV